MQCVEQIKHLINDQNIETLYLLVNNILNTLIVIVNMWRHKFGRTSTDIRLTFGRTFENILSILTRITNSCQTKWNISFHHHHLIILSWSLFWNSSFLFSRYPPSDILPKKTNCMGYHIHEKHSFSKTTCNLYAYTKSSSVQAANTSLCFQVEQRSVSRCCLEAIFIPPDSRRKGMDYSLLEFLGRCPPWQACRINNRKRPSI